MATLTGYHISTNSAEKKGIQACAQSQKPPVHDFININIEDHDKEGRVLTSEFDDFYLVNVYVPNSGDGLKRLEYRSEWDKKILQII